MVKPAFDPSKPYETVAKPAFDPNKPFEDKVQLGSFNFFEDSAPIKQEMHPSFTAENRRIVKNWAKDPQAAVDYLKKEHPGMEIQTRPSGQIIGRKKGEKEFKVLDPDTGIDLTSWEGIKESLMDVTDIGTDIAQGAITTAGTVAGGIAGAIPTGGAGALPGAALGGAAASAATEALRTKAGQFLGIPQEVTGGQLAGAAGVGAVSPLLFGTGAGAKEFAKAGVKELSKGTTGQAAKNMLDSQRGAISRGLGWAKEKVFPWIGEKTSGVPATAIKALGKDFPALKQMEADPLAVTNLSKSAANKIGGKLGNLKKEAWSKYQDALEATDQNVDMSGIIAQLQSKIQEAEDLYKLKPTEASKETVTKLKSLMNKHFTKKVKGLEMGPDKVLKSIEKNEAIGQLPIKAAAKLDQELNELAQYNKLKPQQMGIGPAIQVSPGDREVSVLAGQLKKSLNQEMDAVLPAGALDLKKQYSDIRATEDVLGPLFKNPKKAYQTMKNLETEANTTTLEYIGEAQRKYGIDIVPELEKAEMYKYFAKPSSQAISGFGSTSTSRTIPLSLGGSAAGYYLGSQYGGEGHGSGVLGGFLGGFLGGTLGSPMMTRRLMGLGTGAGRAAQAVQQSVPGRPLQTIPLATQIDIWRQMQDGGTR